MDACEKLTFVCCIEHGRLEQQTLLMLRTLRAHAGRLAAAPVLVVVGRRGARLSDQTKAELEELGATLVLDYGRNPAAWFNYSNKLAAVAIAEQQAVTPLVAWLDSDVLVAAEPTGLLLADDEDFAGRCEYLPPAAHEGASLQVPYWRSVCDLLGTTFEDLPVIAYDHPAIRMRLFFNSGVFVWRRGSTFVRSYRDAFARLLASRIAQHDGNFVFADQVVIAPVVIRERLRWKHLAFTDHHMTFPGQIDGISASPSMAGSSIIHYSGSLKPLYRAAFMSRLDREVPHIAEAVQRWDTPFRASVMEMGVATVYRVLRGLRLRWYAAGLQCAPKGEDLIA